MFLSLKYHTKLAIFGVIISCMNFLKGRGNLGLSKCVIIFIKYILLKNVYIDNQKKSFHICIALMTKYIRNFLNFLVS